MNLQCTFDSEVRKKPCRDTMRTWESMRWTPVTSWSGGGRNEQIAPPNPPACPRPGRRHRGAVTEIFRQALTTSWSGHLGRPGERRGVASAEYLQRIAESGVHLEGRLVDLANGGLQSRRRRSTRRSGSPDRIAQWRSPPPGASVTNRAALRPSPDRWPCDGPTRPISTSDLE